MKQKEIQEPMYISDTSRLASGGQYQSRRRRAERRKHAGKRRRRKLLCTFAAVISMTAITIAAVKAVFFTEKNSVLENVWAKEAAQEAVKEGQKGMAGKETSAAQAVSSSQEASAKQEVSKNQESEGTVLDLTGKSIHEGSLILVNADYGVSEVEVPELANVYEEKDSSYYVKDRTVDVKEEIMDALNQMLTQFKQESGKSDVMVISGFRTQDYQKKLYQEDLRSKNTSSSEYVAKPGYSEHQTGLAVDFGVYKPSHTNQEYDGTGVYAWINEHCTEYGFVVRYEKDKQSITGIGYEPWHFRYVGIPHAQIMKEEKLCLEEYIEFLKQYTKDAPYSYETDTESFQIFYVNQQEASVRIPEHMEYEISGNNIDGWIITLHIQ